jgi:hypothetical protein
MLAALATSAAACVGLTAAPASASTPLAGVGLDSSGGGYTVASQCSIVVGETTDIRFITYAVQASADAAGPSVAVGTGVICTVYSGGVARGGASGGLPGPHAAAVGFATVPVGQVPSICVHGGATFLNGASVPNKPC